MIGSVPSRHLCGGFIALFASIVLAAPSQSQTIVSGTLSTDTTWDLAGSPYIVSPFVRVNGATLTIEPGVEVRFADGGYLAIGPRFTQPATLIARGTKTQPISFTADAASPVKGSWASVSFGQNAVPGVRDANGAWVSGSVLEHCVVTYGGGNHYNEIGPPLYDFNRIESYGSVEFVATSPVVRFVTCRWSDERGIYADMTESNLPVVITDSLFEENGSDPQSGDGGGLTLANTIGSLVERCVFRANRIDNRIRFGAGLGVLYGGNLTVRDCLFEDNDAERYQNGIGGGMNLYSVQTALIENCEFIDNAASIGGAIGDFQSNGITVTDCYFEGNTTISDVVGGSGSNWTVEHSTFVDNQAEGAGAGLTLRGSGGEVRHNVFRENTAAAAGGAMVWYDTIFEYNVVEDNTAEWTGGGVFLSDSGGWPGPSGAVFAHNVVRGNEAGAVGGGVCISLDNSTLIGNEITDNTAGDAGGGVYIKAPYDEPTMTVTLAGSPGIYNTIWGNTSPRGDAICNDLASTSLVVNANGVCWGTASAVEIEDAVWHGVDDPALGLVSFSDVVDCAAASVADALEAPVAVPFMTTARPNPFRAHTTFSFDLSRSQSIHAEVFDVMGRRVAELASGAFPGGSHSLTWDGRDTEGRDVASGSYILRLDTGSEERSQKLIVVR